MSRARPGSRALFGKTALSLFPCSSSFPPREPPFVAEPTFALPFPALQGILIVSFHRTDNDDESMVVRAYSTGKPREVAAQQGSTALPGPCLGICGVLLEPYWQVLDFNGLLAPGLRSEYEKNIQQSAVARRENALLIAGVRGQRP